MKTCTTATEAVKHLWEEKFFKTWRKKSDVTDYLDKHDHHFGDAELGMALKRAKFLTSRGKKGSYEYIQKHPFMKEVGDGKRSKKNK